MTVSPPRPKGPALNALRAFEAAARLESFASAAEELSVTAGAISQHIKALEEWAGVPLFRRNAQGVRLTPEGRAIAPAFVKAFDALGDAIRGLRDVRPTRDIQIATMPSLAQLWLPPRLRQIRETFPHIRLSVTALEVAPNLRRELFDLSLFIRQPSGSDQEIVVRPDVIYPICAPELAALIAAPEDLANHPLLYDRSWSDDWGLWAKAAKVELATIGDGAQYSLFSLAQEEAKSGAGVLMGHAILSDSAVSSGELVRLFDVACQTDKSLVLEAATRKEHDPELVEILTILAS